MLTKRKKWNKTMESLFSLDKTTATNQSSNFTLSSTKGYSMNKGGHTIRKKTKPSKDDKKMIDTNNPGIHCLRKQDFTTRRQCGSI